MSFAGSFFPDAYFPPSYFPKEGAVAPATPQGFEGFLDFVGFPVAVKLAVPLAAQAQGFLGLLDFVGFPVGQPLATPLAVVPQGFSGFLDFVGYPVAQGVPVVTAPPVQGFLGFLDFVGYPVAQGSPVRKGHGKTVGGKRRLALLLADYYESIQAQERLRSLAQAARAKERKETLFKQEQERELARLRRKWQIQTIMMEEA